MGTKSHWPLAILLGAGAAGCNSVSPNQDASARPEQMLAKPAVPERTGQSGDAVTSSLIESPLGPTQAPIEQRATEHARYIERILAERQLARDASPQKSSDHSESQEANPGIAGEVDPHRAAKASAQAPRLPKARLSDQAHTPTGSAPLANAGENALPANPPTPGEPGDAATAGDFGDASPRSQPLIASLDVPTRKRLTLAPDPAAPDARITDISADVGPRPGIDPFVAIQRVHEQRVSQDPRDVLNQLDLQIVRYLREQPVPSMPELTALPVEDREIIAAVLDGLSNYRSAVRSQPNPLSSHKARPFMEMADRIRARADLTVNSATLCTAVAGFGNYEPIEPARFPAGAGSWAVFYCEVDGFLPQLNDKQQWETKLSLELRLYTESGMEVWSAKREEVVDRSRKRRRDFFINKKMQVPDKLAPGRYFLKASVRDLNANRVSESTIPLDVVAR